MRLLKHGGYLYLPPSSPSVSELKRRLEFVESRLRILREMLENGEISKEEFERLYRQWALASLRLRLVLQEEIKEEMLKRTCGGGYHED